MFKSIYVKTFIFLVLYVIVTRFIFLAMVIYPNTAVAFTIPSITASLSGLGFLYVFTHHFPFGKIIKNKKKKREEQLIHKFIFLGKWITCLTIGIIGGPLFAALTISIVLSSYKYKYLFVVFICVISIFISLGIARGVFLGIEWLINRTA